jgi:hypothetical protein
MLDRALCRPVGVSKYVSLYMSLVKTSIMQHENVRTHTFVILDAYCTSTATLVTGMRLIVIVLCVSH